MASCTFPGCDQPINSFGQHDSPIQYAYHRVAQGRQDLRFLERQIANCKEKLRMNEEDLEVLLADPTGSYV